MSKIVRTVVQVVLSVTALLVVGSATAGPAAKIEVCHIPPGNPDNAHTITISENALPAHLAHGDTEGACDETVVKFSATFPPSDQSAAWDAFEAQLSATTVYNEIQVFSDTDPGYTCTGPEADTICQAIRTQTNEACVFVPPTTVSCGGNVWSVGVCGGTELNVNSPACDCIDPATSIRAEIDAACGGAPNQFGAVNGNTCSGATTTLTVICK